MRIVLALLIITGCSKYVVRSPGVYQSEVEFLSDAGVEVAELLLTEALAQPDGDEGTAKCVALAEPALVVISRSPYHAKMMLHLGNLGDDPGDPPQVPTAEDMCAVRLEGE